MMKDALANIRDAVWASSVRMRDVFLAIVIVAAVVFVLYENERRAAAHAHHETALRACLVTARPIIAGTRIQESDVRVRLKRVPQSAVTFADKIEVMEQRATRSIGIDVVLKPDHFDTIAPVTGPSSFWVVIPAEHVANAVSGGWITLVRTGSAPPKPTALFRVCSVHKITLADGEVKAHRVMLKACHAADAIDVLAVGGTGAWVPVPVVVDADPCSK